MPPPHPYKSQPLPQKPQSAGRQPDWMTTRLEDSCSRREPFIGMERQYHWKMITQEDNLTMSQSGREPFRKSITGK